MTPKKMAAIESAQSNDTVKMSMLDQSKASMIHISVLPCATGPLTMLESVTDRSTRLATRQKLANCLFSDFLLLSLYFHWDSTTKAEAITTIITRRNSRKHEVVHPLTYCSELKLVSDSQVTQRLPLYTILLDYNIIHSRYTPIPPPPPSPPKPEA